MTKTALITGILGQDGAYLAKLLLDKGYKVVGGTRRSGSDQPWRLERLGIADAVTVVPLEMLELTNLLRALEGIKPDEVYNLAAQSFVSTSFDQPIYTSEVDGLGVVRLLESVRMACPEARFYQASTSEMFGKIQEPVQSERTPFYPRSPYGVAKVFGHWMTVNYRESHGLFTTSGILFNHESPLRGTEFVTRKITIGLARFVAAGGPAIELGNLDAKRDWGFAGDYVEGMWRMLQHSEPDDFVLATGKTSSIRRFVELAGQAAGVDIEWEGEAEQTVGRDRKTGRVAVRVNPAFFRPAEVDILIGDSSKAREKLGWVPKVSVDELAGMMMDADLEETRRTM